MVPYPLKGVFSSLTKSAKPFDISEFLIHRPRSFECRTRSPTLMPSSSHRPPLISRTASVFSFGEIGVKEWGWALWCKCIIRPPASKNKISKGIKVFFIQKLFGPLVENMNSMPAFLGISRRYMRPRWCASGVTATSTMKTCWLPAVAIVTFSEDSALRYQGHKSVKASGNNTRNFIKHQNRFRFCRIKIPIENGVY